MTAGRAWMVLGAAITAYELAAADDQLLTHGVRRGRAKHPMADVVITVGIVVTTLHLLDSLGPADPYRLLHLVRRR